MEKLLAGVGSLLYGMRFSMLFFYVGLVLIIIGILGKFIVETYKLMNTLLFGDLAKIDLIIKVLELVDMTMVAQLVWVVALAGVSLFVTTGHFDSREMRKPDWLDHVNTYNLKLKLAFAIISISGVHALKTYLSGDLSVENVRIVAVVALIHFTFVLSAIGISFAERLTRDKH
ncbi:MAG: YqhA family protein [Lautropia sp.]